MAAQDIYGKRVPKPNPEYINSGLSPLKLKTVQSVFGHARSKEDYTQEYQDTDNVFLREMLLTENVPGLGKVRGLRPAVESLMKISGQINAMDRDLLSALSSAGMLNCRLVRGSKTQVSRHAYGAAIDLKVNGVLDAMGDEYTQVGLLAVYKFFHNEGWYWGAGFSREDSMHFEVSEEKFREWFSAVFTTQKMAKLEKKVMSVKPTKTKAAKAKAAKAKAVKV